MDSSENLPQLFFNGDATFNVSCTPSDLRKFAHTWTLGGDAQLLGYMQNFSNKIISQSQDIQKRLDILMSHTKTMDVKLNNVFNDFNALANMQFVENRVYDDDLCIHQPPSEEKPKVPEMTEQERDAEMMRVMKDVVALGKKVIARSDDAMAKDRYSSRRLPVLIGSQAFLQHSFPETPKNRADMAALSQLHPNDVSNDVDKLSLASEASETKPSSSLESSLKVENNRKEIDKIDKPKSRGLFNDETAEESDDDDLFSRPSKVPKTNFPPQSGKNDDFLSSLAAAFHKSKNEDVVSSASSSVASENAEKHQKSKKVKSLFDDSDDGDDANDLFTQISNIVNEQPAKDKTKTADAQESRGMGGSPPYGKVPTGGVSIFGNNLNVHKIIAQSQNKEIDDSDKDLDRLVPSSSSSSLDSKTKSRHNNLVGPKKPITLFDDDEEDGLFSSLKKPANTELKKQQQQGQQKPLLQQPPQQIQQPPTPKPQQKSEEPPIQKPAKSVPVRSLFDDEEDDEEDDDIFSILAKQKPAVPEVRQPVIKKTENDKFQASQNVTSRVVPVSMEGPKSKSMEAKKVRSLFDDDDDDDEDNDISDNKDNRISDNKDNTISDNKDNRISDNKEITISNNKDNTISDNKDNRISVNKDNTISDNKDNTISDNKDNRISHNKDNTISNNRYTTISGKTEGNKPLSEVAPKVKSLFDDDDDDDDDDDNDLHGFANWKSETKTPAPDNPVKEKSVPPSILSVPRPDMTNSPERKEKEKVTTTTSKKPVLNIPPTTILTTTTATTATTTGDDVKEPKTKKGFLFDDDEDDDADDLFTALKKNKQSEAAAAAESKVDGLSEKKKEVVIRKPSSPEQASILKGARISKLQTSLNINPLSLGPYSRKNFQKVKVEEPSEEGNSGKTNSTREANVTKHDGGLNGVDEIVTSSFETNDLDLKGTTTLHCVARDRAKMPGRRRPMTRCPPNNDPIPPGDGGNIGANNSNSNQSNDARESLFDTFEDRLSESLTVDMTLPNVADTKRENPRLTDFLDECLDVSSATKINDTANNSLVEQIFSQLSPQKDILRVETLSHELDSFSDFPEGKVTKVSNTAENIKDNLPQSSNGSSSLAKQSDIKNFFDLDTNDDDDHDVKNGINTSTATIPNSTLFGEPPPLFSDNDDDDDDDGDDLFGGSSKFLSKSRTSAMRCVPTKVEKKEVNESNRKLDIKSDNKPQTVDNIMRGQKVDSVKPKSLFSFDDDEEGDDLLTLNTAKSPTNQNVSAIPQAALNVIPPTSVLSNNNSAVQSKLTFDNDDDDDDDDDDDLFSDASLFKKKESKPLEKPINENILIATSTQQVKKPDNNIPNDIGKFDDDDDDDNDDLFSEKFNCKSGRPVKVASKAISNKKNLFRDSDDDIFSATSSLRSNNTLSNSKLSLLKSQHDKSSEKSSHPFEDPLNAL